MKHDNDNDPGHNADVGDGVVMLMAMAMKVKMTKSLNSKTIYFSINMEGFLKKANDMELNK